MEKVTTLYKSDNLEICKIISVSPLPDAVFLDDRFECGYLIKGKAIITYPTHSQKLKSGSFFIVPRNTTHTVSFKSRTAIWLTYHFK